MIKERSLIAFSYLIIVYLLLFPGCSSQYYTQYKTESIKRLSVPQSPRILTEQDIVRLPVPVQKYLIFTGSVNKPFVYNLRVRFEGGMKRKMTADWMDVDVQQHEFFGEYARLFYIHSSMYGIPFDGLHSYLGDSAVMQISVAGLFRVVDAQGDTMTRSETVTLFNDMCLMAPSTLLDSTIRWEQIDSLTVKAEFTNRSHTITAVLFFDPSGALINFSSDDRFLSEDGSSYTNYRWTTPVSDYRDFHGRKVPSYGEAIWHTPDGPFPYARFRTVDIEYNCSTFQ